MNKLLPDWVAIYKKKGYRIQFRNNKYYYYKSTSKKVPGLKNPQPVHKYIGRITEEGLIKSRYEEDDIKVYEYGFSKLCLCLASEYLSDMKPCEIIGSIIHFLYNDTNIYYYEASCLSLLYPKINKSFVPSIKLMDAINNRISILEYSLNDIKAIFSNIYLVRLKKQTKLSNISDKVIAILKDLKIDLEEFTNVKKTINR